MVCLGSALFVALVGAPLIPTVVAQIRLMAAEPMERRAYDAFRGELFNAAAISSLARACRDLMDRPDAEPNADRYPTWDRSNGIHTYLGLLPLLRRRGELPTSQPADADATILSLLNRCLSVPPARIYGTEERTLAERALRRCGLPSRTIAVEADRIRYAIPGVRGSSLPVLRDLADRLNDQARFWRSVGRDDDADAACRVVIRLMTDVLDDFPSPELALLAAEKLPPAVRGLGAEAEARRVGAFRQRWHEVAREDRVNLVPWTGDFVLALEAHERVLRSLGASVVSVGGWLTLMVICLFLLLVVVVTRPSADVHFGWRWGGRGAWVAPVIACGPVIVLVAVVAVADIRWTWLISAPSVPAAAFLPAVVPVLVGLATRLCVRPGRDYGKSLIPMAAVWGMAVLLVLTAVGGVVFLPLGTETWRPPAAVQRFRQLGVLVGAACAILVGTWIVWGIIRRARAGLPAGVWARANLAVASAALLVVSFVSLAALGVNQVSDGQHRRAFAEAAADPITDRLGENWRRDHFTPARALVELRSRP